MKKNLADCFITLVLGIKIFGHMENVKQAEVQPAEIHPLYLCQFAIYGCVFIKNFLNTDKNTTAFSYVHLRYIHYNAVQNISESSRAMRKLLIILSLRAHSRSRFRGF